jgi:hypothetical protein
VTDLDVIVVSWNTRELLRACLASVRAGEGVSVTLWVVDNGSADGSAEMVRREFPAARLIENPANLGFATANNQALAHRRGRYVVLLNSDAVLPPDGLARLMRQLEDRPAAGAVGPMYVHADGRFQASFADFPSARAELLQAYGLSRWLLGRDYPSHRAEDSRVGRAVEWLPGTCLMVRSAAIDQIGLLDDGFFLYAEEMDWCYRLWQAGWEVWYCPEVVVVHHLSQSAGQANEARLWHLYRGKIRFFAKHHGAARAWCLKWGLVAMLGVKAARCRLVPATRPRDAAAWRMYVRLAARLAHELVVA